MISYEMACSEVFELLKILPKDEYKKIPKDIIQYYDKNRNREYIFNIDPNKSLLNQNISKEANSIIIKLFCNYFATENQKNMIMQILQRNSIEDEEKKEKMYRYDSLFKETINQENVKEIKEEKMVIICNENSETFFQKILCKIRNFIKHLF